MQYESLVLKEPWLMSRAYGKVSLKDVLCRCIPQGLNLRVEAFYIRTAIPTPVLRYE